MTDLTFIHIGDLHGHLVPRPSLRGDGPGGHEGGLARMATLIKQIRAERPNTILVNTGDTIQGSAEALFTRGQALVDVVDLLGVDVFAPGNWDYLYGKDRFLELFGPGTGQQGATALAASRRWGALAANVYHAGTREFLLPPTGVLDLNGVRVGFVGLSSERAINALGPWATDGVEFSADVHEIPGHVAALRADAVDLVVLVSEFGLAKNVLIAEANPLIDVVLSSDMHEETRRVVETSTGALVSEVGQDGARVGVLGLSIDDDGAITSSYTLHIVSEDIEPDPEVEELVAEVRRPFLAPGFRPHRNPINGTWLTRPIDEVVGHTEVPLHRSGFVHDERPAVISGTSHDMIAAAIRSEAGADIGHFRGFRCGTHVAPGPVRLEDLFHFMPVGATVGAGEVRGAQIAKLLENSADGALNPDPWNWRGGWLDACAGVTYDLDPAAARGSRTSGVTVRRAGATESEPLDPEAAYTVSGYYYRGAPEKVGPLEAENGEVTVLTGTDGQALDVTEVVARHLSQHAVKDLDPGIGLSALLPGPVHRNPEIQPLHGASPDT